MRWLLALVGLLALGCAVPSELEEVGESEEGLAVADRSWRAVLLDDFDAPVLDRNVWATSFAWGARSLPVNNHQQCFNDENVRLENGFALLEARRQTSTCDGRTVAYGSGMLSAHPSMSQRYGYFEMRAVLAEGQGFWSSFWLLPQPTPGARYEEIDVVEMRGNRPDQANMTVHVEVDGVRTMSSTGHTQCPACGPDFASALHTYAVRWEAGSITWFIDGIQRKIVTATNGDVIPSRAAYVIASFPVGGLWPGMPDSSTPFPSVLAIDSIKALQRVNGAGANPNRIVNPGFEAGVANWNLQGGAGLGTVQRSGVHAMRIVGFGGANQLITGLEPNTPYRLTGYVRSATATTAMIGVKEFGGAPQLQNPTSRSTWGPVSLVFSTGDNTTARVFVFQSVADGDVSFDDLSLTTL